MQGPPRESAENLESALLFLGRSLGGLAAGLQRLLPGDQLELLAKAAGRRRPGLRGAPEVVADGVIRLAKYRQQVVQALIESLPEAADLPEELLVDDRLELLRRGALLGQLRRDLCGPDQADWERAERNLERWAARLDPAAADGGNHQPAPGPAAAKPRKEPASRVRKLEDEKRGLQDRLKDQQRQLSRLQDELGREHKRRESLREERDELRARAAEADTRAAESKRRLKEAGSPSDRERLLVGEAEEAQARLHVVEQKFAIILEERDDLRACLEDHDRFSKVVEEEVPSFRDRPLTQAESRLAGKLAERASAGRTPFRVLVVGGGEPQLRHQDKFAEYVEVLGITGLWRMAEYTSWHKEIDLLNRDMERKFDALVVLHWNRTTFTRRARDICNQQGQKPCLTCHYEGFVSLRQTMQECLRQLLARDGRAG